MSISASIHLPDRILNESATAEILGIWRDTLRRLSRRGEGLPEVKAYRDRKPLHAPNEHKSARSRWRSRAIKMNPNRAL